MKNPLYSLLKKLSAKDELMSSLSRIDAIFIALGCDPQEVIKNREYAERTFNAAKKAKG